ncbi:MAG: hypothetical protein M3Y91_08755 [Actinomycetota bacterium]|nr:hypothetical protein [Actinomycetota bacterium]
MADDPRSTDDGERQGENSLLDDWRAEVGDDEIARIVEATRRDADTGVLPGFIDRAALLAHLSDRTYRPA